MMRKRETILAKSNGRCWYCGCELMEPHNGQWGGAPPSDSYSVDHINPVSKGGSSGIDNLVPCCIGCNVIKKAKTVEQFRVYASWRQISVKPFDESQIEWLLENGIDPPFPPLVRFYFERMGSAQ